MTEVKLNPEEDIALAISKLRAAINQSISSASFRAKAFPAACAIEAACFGLILTYMGCWRKNESAVEMSGEVSEVFSQAVKALKSILDHNQLSFAAREAVKKVITNQERHLAQVHISAEEGKFEELHEKIMGTYPDRVSSSLAR